MGVYRFYCQHAPELEFLISVLTPIIKRESSEVTIDWDREKSLYCLIIRDVPLEEDLPF